MYSLGLKFVSKRIFGHDILQLAYIFFNACPSQTLTVEWRSSELVFVAATLCVEASQQPTTLCVEPFLCNMQ